MWSVNTGCLYLMIYLPIVEEYFFLRGPARGDSDIFPLFSNAPFEGFTIDNLLTLAIRKIKIRKGFVFAGSACRTAGAMNSWTVSDSFLAIECLADLCS